MSTKKEGIAGINARHWVNPYGRDTTRGYRESEFPSLHTSKIESRMEVASCRCCGVYYGYYETGKRRSAFCPSHAWLDNDVRLGTLRIIDVSIWQTGEQVSSRCRQLRWRYHIPVKSRETGLVLRDAIRNFLRENYLEQVGLWRLPLVTVFEQEIVVFDIQRLCVDKRSFSVDNSLVKQFLNQIDDITATCDAYAGVSVTRVPTRPHKPERTREREVGRQRRDYTEST